MPDSNQVEKVIRSAWERRLLVVAVERTAIAAAIVLAALVVMLVVWGVVVGVVLGGVWGGWGGGGGRAPLRAIKCASG